MLFLLYSKVNQLYVYICLLFGGFPSRFGQHRALEFPVHYDRFSLVAYFICSTSSVYTYVNPSLPFPPTTFLSSLAPIHLFSTTFALQIRSPLPFFWIPHICVNMRYLFFSFRLHSVWQFLGSSISLQVTQFHSFLWLRNSPLCICPHLYPFLC